MNLNDFSGRSRNADLSKPLVSANAEDLKSQPRPLIPSSLKSFKGMSYLPLYLASLKDSPMFEQSTGDQFKAAITLFMAAWESDPPCSIPNSKPQLERILRLDANEFAECLKQGVLKNGFMNGWILCSNNRFYHPDLARAMATTMNRFAHKDYDMQKARHKREVLRAKLSPEDAAKTAPELKMLAYVPNPDELPIFEVIKPEMVNGKVANPQDFNFVDGWEKLLERHPYNATAMRELGASLFDESEDDDEPCPYDKTTTNELVPTTIKSVPTTNPDDPYDRLKDLDSFSVCPRDIALKVKDKEKEKGKDKEKNYQQEGGRLDEQFDLNDELIVEALMARNTSELRHSALAEISPDIPTVVPGDCFVELEFRTFWSDLGRIGFTDPVKNRMEFPKNVIEDLIALGVSKPIIDRAYDILVQSYGRTAGQSVALFKTILVNFVATLGCLTKVMKYFPESLTNAVLALPPNTLAEFEKMMKKNPQQATELLHLYPHNTDGLKKVIWTVSRQEEGKDLVHAESNIAQTYNPLLSLGSDFK